MLVVLGSAAFARAAAVAQTPAPPPAVLATPTPVVVGTPPPAIADFQAAWARITKYSVTVTLFEQKGAKSENSVYQYTFAKPSTATVHVVSGTNAGKTITWNGGPTVTGTAKGFLGITGSKTFKLNDPTVTTVRGDSIDQLSFGEIIQHVEQTPGTFEQGAGDAIGDLNTIAVTLTPADPAADGGYTREVLELSPATHLPLRILGYEGPLLVRKIDFSDLKIN